jgi:peptide/nickel transport system substrate-binding protein
MNIPGIGNIPNQDFELLDKQGNLNTVLYPTLGFQTMMFNTETLNNKKLRQAIAYAINRQIMVDNLLKGQGEVIDGPYTTANPYYDDSVPTYSYDPAKAKQLLAESGWDLSQKINLVVPVGNKVREQSGNIIMQNLQDIGLKVEITTYDLPTVIQKAGDGQFDLLLISLPMGYDPDVTRYYSKKDNFMRYDNPESDELLAAGTVETDIAKRKVIYSQLQHIWSEDVPALTLYSPMLFAAISKDVAYGQPKQIGMHYNVHNWDVAE